MILNINWEKKNTLIVVKIKEKFWTQLSLNLNKIIKVPKKLKSKTLILLKLLLNVL